MKKLLLVLSVLFLGMTFISCSKDDDNKNDYEKLIVGRWAEQGDQGRWEVYLSDGTGKYWDLKDDVHEDEAKKFDWHFDGKTLIQEIKSDGVHVDVRQACEIEVLSSTMLKYNNEILRTTYTLYRK